MLNAKQTQTAIAIMGEIFPNAKTSLVADSPFHFLLAVILSAQTTDKAVNRLTPALFARYPQPIDLAQADEAEVRSLIKTIGLYRNKSKYLIACAQGLVTKFNGQVPQTRSELLQLAGVGQKTADVVLAECFQIPAIAVDTHVSRVAKRLAIVPKNANVLQIEHTLMKKLPQSSWIAAHHRMIFWGRYQCMARQPKCSTCPLLEICSAGKGLIKKGAAK
ncbi:endonuclease III [Liquorilactobacillus vini]|uniref:Endonuclease III n=1 Tax=Liquorilactobacillus vini DSM 20605 TaxID=1133569 RepID=A0A0R2CH08_9LACO|nr:endonuclease III [Liquorilactobacillus vini]KRM87675.1 endonuclease III [Liquorilactobacillus vini DSM 20605]